MKTARVKSKRSSKLRWDNSAPMALMLISGMEAGPSMPGTLYLFLPQILSQSWVELITEFWKQIQNQYICPFGNRIPGTNFEAVDELSKRNISTVTERRQSLEVVGMGTIPELDSDKVPVVRSRTGAGFGDDGGSVIGHTLEFWMRLHDIRHAEE